METTTCSHKESIGSMVDGIETGECSVCHQARRYDRRETKAIVEVTKLGRIDGKIVIPGPKEKLFLSSEENDELMDAKKDDKKESNPGPIDPVPNEQSSGIKWYRDHKKEMIEDLLAMGYDAFLEKWKVKRQIVSHLKSDELYKRSVGAEKPRAKKPKSHNHKGPPSLEAVVGALKEKGINHLPAFPEFNEQWSDYVKTNWFETYQALKGLEGKQ